MKRILCHLAIWMVFAFSSLTLACEATLTEAPLVQQLGPAEFRLAFGIDAGGCVVQGCGGSVRYRVQWRDDRGREDDEEHKVAYSIPPGWSRSIAIDRHYFHASENDAVTEVIGVQVSAMSCSVSTD